MLQELAFTGQWRHYQKRVLDKSDAFMAGWPSTFGSSSWLWKNNPGNRIYQTLWPANPDLGSYGHHSSAMGGPDYPGILE